jgi:hypothetical protein
MSGVMPVGMRLPVKYAPCRQYAPGHRISPMRFVVIDGGQKRAGGGYCRLWPVVVLV